MSLYHLGVLHCFDRNVTRAIYSQEILRGAIAQYVRQMGMEESDIIEDLDRKHSLYSGVSHETA